MIIAVGSKNVVKVQAVQEAFQESDHFNEVIIHSYDVPSRVSEQPLSLEEIIQGAQNRARAAFTAQQSCDYGIGIESGLFKAPGTMTNYLESCICCIFDGKNFHTGLSCGFEVPSHILELVLTKNMNLSEACFHAGITKNQQLGSAEGLIGILTKNKIDRKTYTKQAVTTALVQLVHAEWYKK